MTLSSSAAAPSSAPLGEVLVGAEAADGPAGAVTSRPAAPMTSRRARNKAEKQARILAAAQSLLREIGYERMTTAEVAKRAQVAAGTVFQYAPTKAELLMMVVEHEWRDVVAEALPDGGTGKGARHDIMCLLFPLAQEARRHPGYAMVVGRELLFGAPGPYREKVLAFVTDLEDAITRLLVAAGGEASRSTVAAGLIVSGCVLELNRTRTGRAEAESVSRRLSQLVDVAVRGAGV